MPQAMPLQTFISQASQSATKPRIKRVQFGDGYVQEAPEGLNRFPEEWSLTWQNLELAELQIVITAFKSVAGTDYLTWTSPYGAAEQKWRVGADGWSVTVVAGALYTVSAKVVEWFQ